MFCAQDYICIEDDQGNGDCECKEGLVELDDGSCTASNLIIIEGEVAGMSEVLGESFTDEALYLEYGPITAIEIKSGWWIDNIRARQLFLTYCEIILTETFFQIWRNVGTNSWRGRRSQL